MATDLPCELCGAVVDDHVPADGHRYRNRVAAKLARLAELEAGTNPDRPQGP